jgi:hypothetical protein
MEAERICKKITEKYKITPFILFFTFSNFTLEAQNIYLSSGFKINRISTSQLVMPDHFDQFDHDLKLSLKQINKTNFSFDLNLLLETTTYNSLSLKSGVYLQGKSFSWTNWYWGAVPAGKSQWQSVDNDTKIAYLVVPILLSYNLITGGRELKFHIDVGPYLGYKFFDPGDFGSFYDFDFGGEILAGIGSKKWQLTGYLLKGLRNIAKPSWTIEKATETVFGLNFTRVFSLNKRTVKLERQPLPSERKHEILETRSDTSLRLQVQPERQQDTIITKSDTLGRQSVKIWSQSDTLKTISDITESQPGKLNRRPDKFSLGISEGIGGAHWNFSPAIDFSFFKSTLKVSIIPFKDFLNLRYLSVGFTQGLKYTKNQNLGWIVSLNFSNSKNTASQFGSDLDIGITNYSLTSGIRIKLLKVLKLDLQLGALYQNKKSGYLGQNQEHKFLPYGELSLGIDILRF